MQMLYNVYLWDMMSLNVLHIPKRTSRCLFGHFFFLSNLFLKKGRAMIILQEGPLFQSQGTCKSNGGITATPNRQRVDSCCRWENGKEARHYNIDFNDPLGKVPNLVCEVERYQQNAVGLTIIHSFGSGTNSLIDGGLGPTQELSIVRWDRCGYYWQITGWVLHSWTFSRWMWGSPSCGCVMQREKLLQLFAHMRLFFGW